MTIIDRASDFLFRQWQIELAGRIAVHVFNVELGHADRHEFVLNFSDDLVLLVGDRLTYYVLGWVVIDHFLVRANHWYCLMTFEVSW